MNKLGSVCLFAANIDNYKEVKNVNSTLKCSSEN